MLPRFRALGRTDASIDAAGNVVGLRRGVGNGPQLVVSAHLDTVFPAGTDVRIKDRDGRLYVPGIADDTRGLAVLLAWIKALNEKRHPHRRRHLVRRQCRRGGPRRSARHEARVPGPTR